MLDVMRHRSPDGMNVSKGDFCIGMGRLAIIDPTNQDFPFEHEGYTLAFNGEIYNYLELRKEMEELGVVFRTNTDTEVLLRAYLYWGNECLNHFNGMFAFGIRNPNGDIFLARDLAGEKPLYYATEPFRFASEAKALNYDCQELPRGHLLYARDRELYVSKWFTPRKIEVPHNFDTAVSVLGMLLEDAVKIRTRSDVPYGIYLSDGIDSNLIYSYQDFDHVFTYRDGDYKQEFLATLPTIVHHLDYPVKSFSAYGLWKLAQNAHEAGVKVVLSGEGADELFGGYVRYVGNEFNRKAHGRFPSYEGLFPHRDMMMEEFDGNMQELLRMGDRMASAWGVENRCPFLDRRIIEFAWSLPMKWKIDGYETKIILQELLRRRNPTYNFKEKHGLYVSCNRWLGAADDFDKTVYLEAQNKIWKTFL